MYCFGRQTINIPTISSARRVIRNKKILDLYRQGKNYAELSIQFSITERWIRNIVKIMIYRSISR